MQSMPGVLSGEVRRHVTFGAGRYPPAPDVCQNIVSKKLTSQYKSGPSKSWGEEAVYERL